MTDPIGFSLADGLGLLGMGAEDFWWLYAANGGRADVNVLTDRIAGRTCCDAAEHDLIAQTLNECFLDRGLAGFPVRYAPRAARPARTPSDAVTTDGGVLSPRQAAAIAKQRSIEAAREAAALHISAARLMQRSGQLVFAAHAQNRAASAQRRVGAALTRVELSDD